MSRRVGCSYGKQAGFVGAKINIISEHSKYFETFLQKKTGIPDLYRILFVFLQRPILSLWTDG